MAVGAPLPFSQRISSRQWLSADIVAGILIGSSAVGATIVGHEPGPHGGAWDAVRIVVSVAAVAALPWRRARPRQVLAGTAVLASVLIALGGHGPVTIVVALALYSTAAAADRRLDWATVGSVIGLVALAALVARGGPDWGAALSGPAVVSVGWLAGENTRTRRAYMEAVAERAAEREAEREERVRRAAADERVRIARELHDVVAHAMSVIAVRSGVARVVLDTQPEEAREALGIIETTSRRALQEMRLIVGVLRQTNDSPADLTPAPGLGDLDELIAQVAQAGVAVELETEGEPRPLPPGMDLSAYRIVQEALTNVVRHAGPTAAHVAVRYGRRNVEIEVTDEGGPAAAKGAGGAESPGGGAAATRPARGTESPGGGHGLVGMHERVALYGGDLTAAPGERGFRVLAHLPTDQDGP